MKRLILALLALLLFAQNALAAGRYEAVKLLVQESAVQGGAIEAGSQAALRIKIRNTNEYVAAGNCVFTLSDPSGAIVPRGPSGVYVQEIARGGETEIEFLLEAMPDALPGSVKLLLSAEYETAQGGAGAMQADVYVTVSQEMRLEHGAVSLPAKLTEGDNASCAVEFMNMGKGTAYNVLMQFSVPGLDGGSAVLVGNVPPGESATGRANLSVHAPEGKYGPVSGSVRLSWEDAAGKIYEKELPLETEICKKIPVEEMAAQEKQKEEPTFPAWVPGAAIAAVGVGAVIAIQIGIEKRRQRERDEKLL